MVVQDRIAAGSFAQQRRAYCRQGLADLRGRHVVRLGGQEGERAELAVHEHLGAERCRQQILCRAAVSSAVRLGLGTLQGCRNSFSRACVLSTTGRLPYCSRHHRTEVQNAVTWLADAQHQQHTFAARSLTARMMGLTIQMALQSGQKLKACMLSPEAHACSACDAGTAVKARATASPEAAEGTLADPGTLRQSIAFQQDGRALGLLQVALSDAAARHVAVACARQVDQHRA